ncbi:hypothetical protein J3R83DRAFT_2741 [Lanmaoa asiatica]|nr:hypothetical protein J3R83DRAFT_2741 [Lanmaoa asiatica]
MSHLLFWPTITYFYPVGNTSAVCLTEDLPPESKADILLLACGDPRHILYTIYADETNPLTRLRMFDITCCDVDVAILARNALLFTLLVDDGVLDKLDGLWNLFYHMYVDQTSLSMLFGQCRKLVALAESLETWRAGPYGHFLAVCDAATLGELRRVWTTYLNTSTFSSKQVKRFEQRFIDGKKEMSRRAGPGGTTTAARSAGPLTLHAAQVVSRQFSSYWSSGTTDNGVQGQKQRLTVNPTFTFSIDGDKFAVHYGTDPLSGFHLAEAFTSGEFTRPHERIPPHEVVRVARDQFSRWCTSVSKRLKSNNPSSPTFVIRMFAGDALMFCQALKYCEVTRSPVTPYNVAAWRLSTITLDDRYYGCNALSPAPLSFNVIDTSNILDHTGLVNVLVVTAPLLCKTSSATLYTEALLRTGDDPSQAILEHVCGDLPTMGLLLGIIPSMFISQFTTRSNVHETLAMSEDAKQYHERLAWKVIGLGGTTSQRLSFPPEELAAFLFRVYLRMFSDEDVRSRFQLLSLSPERMLRELQRSGILHYNRRSFALFVHFVKTRIRTDWWRTMDLFEDLVLADGPLIMGQHAYQELCCQLHILGVYTTPWLSIPALRRIQYKDIIFDDDDLGLFRNWTRTHIPQVVTLVLVVPRDAIARLEPDFMTVGTPVLQCDIHDGPRQNWFAVTSATFGSLRVSGTGEHRMGVLVEGDCRHECGAPLIITFSVPSSSVVDFTQNPRATVGLALRPTMGVTAKFADQLGFNLTVFRTRLADAERVFVLARRPVVGTSTSMGTGKGAGAGAVMADRDHWQENTRKVLYSEQPTSSPDMPHTSGEVHVKMDDMFSAVQSFTIRIDVTDPNARATLADVQIVPTVSPGSGSTRSLDACVRIGTHSYTVQFPLPVDVASAKLRVARRSSYIEVVAPPALFDVRPERDLSNLFASLSLDPNDDGIPTLGSIHRINLNRCPTFKLPKNITKLNWCNVHVSLMFSELEKGRVLHDAQIDTLVHVKQTLHLLLRSAAGANPDDDGQTPNRVFALFDTSRGVAYLYIIVARMCLDVGSHTVVADAFVALGTPSVRAALRDTYMSTGHGRGQGARSPDDLAIQYISTDADETAAWFHLLPRLTERCRTWPHKASCAYRTSKQHQQQKTGERSLGTWGKQSPLCTCGAGVGTEILPKQFERLAPNLMRAAFSPLFSVPYLKEVDVPVGGPVTGMGTPRQNDIPRVGCRCRSCGKDGGLTCSRCKRARYCSKECQHADWKMHKKDCESTFK